MMQQRAICCEVDNEMLPINSPLPSHLYNSKIKRKSPYPYIGSLCFLMKNCITMKNKNNNKG